MKIRTGFVSNSSSTSFIVVFNRSELTVEFLKEKLYHNADAIPYEYNWGSDYQTFDTELLCGAIINTLSRAVDYDKDGDFDDNDNSILGTFRNMSHYDNVRFPEHPDWDNSLSKEERQLEWKEYEKEHDEVAQELCDEFAASLNENDCVFIGTFADDDPMGNQLEHGGTFNPVRHVRCNQH